MTIVENFASDGGGPLGREPREPWHPAHVAHAVPASGSASHPVCTPHRLASAKPAAVSAECPMGTPDTTVILLRVSASFSVRMASAGIRIILPSLSTCGRRSTSLAAASLREAKFILSVTLGFLGLHMTENAMPDQLGRVPEALNAPVICAKPDGGRQHRAEKLIGQGWRLVGVLPNGRPGRSE